MIRLARILYYWLFEGDEWRDVRVRSKCGCRLLVRWAVRSGVAVAALSGCRFSRTATGFMVETMNSSQKDYESFETMRKKFINKCE